MEKFGIFELLDALSALTAPDSAPSAKNDKPLEQTPQPPRAEDAAFSPPVYGGFSPEQPAAEQHPSGEQDALSALLSRQEEISRRIDKRR